MQESTRQNWVRQADLARDGDVARDETRTLPHDRDTAGEDGRASAAFHAGLHDEHLHHTQRLRLATTLALGALGLAGGRALGLAVAVVRPGRRRLGGGVGDLAALVIDTLLGGEELVEFGLVGGDAVAQQQVDLLAVVLTAAAMTAATTIQALQATVVQLDELATAVRIRVGVVHGVVLSVFVVVPEVVVVVEITVVVPEVDVVINGLIIVVPVVEEVWIVVVPEVNVEVKGSIVDVPVIEVVVIVVVPEVVVVPIVDVPENKVAVILVVNELVVVVKVVVCH